MPEGTKNCTHCLWRAHDQKIPKKDGYLCNLCATERHFAVKDAKKEAKESHADEVVFKDLTWTKEQIEFFTEGILGGMEESLNNKANTSSNKSG